MWLCVCIHNIHLCTQGYIHCTDREGINTCTFSQSYKPRNLYTHNASEGTPGLDTQKCLLVGGTGEEAQDPVYKRLRPLSYEERLTLQTDIKVKTFSESHNQWRREVGPWRMWVAVLPCWAFPGLEGSSLQGKDVHIRRCHLPWPRLRGAEMSPIAPPHVRPLPLENGQDALRLSSLLRPWNLGPQPRAACQAEGRVEARVLC